MPTFTSHDEEKGPSSLSVNVVCSVLHDDMLICKMFYFIFFLIELINNRSVLIVRINYIVDIVFVRRNPNVYSPVVCLTWFSIFSVNVHIFKQNNEEEAVIHGLHAHGNVVH